MYTEEKSERKVSINDDMQGSYLGPEYSQEEIERDLKKLNAKFNVLSKDEIITETAKYLSEGKAIGWFQGRIEFGPRALGCRSILGDPRSETMQKSLNLKVKYRESFRPLLVCIKRKSR